MEKTKADKLAKQCYDGARKMMGEGWKHLGNEIRMALIRDRAFSIILAQDESIDPAKVLALAAELNEACDQFFGF
jgi:hypothetical protein